MPKEKKAAGEKPEKKSASSCLAKNVDDQLNDHNSEVLGWRRAQEAYRVQQVHANGNGTFEGGRTGHVAPGQVSRDNAEDNNNVG
jgi:hypothetical protein